MKKRANKEYDRATLEQTEKFSFLSPDFSTLWNYRREIIEHIFATELGGDSEEHLAKKYDMVLKELEFLVKGIMKSPKSYTLWFHRQWIIQKGLDFEKKQLAIKLAAASDALAEWRSRILETELKLCDKMLALDERNFHCWNYRLTITLEYLQEIKQRISEDAKQHEIQC